MLIPLIDDCVLIRNKYSVICVSLSLGALVAGFLLTLICWKQRKVLIFKDSCFLLGLTLWLAGQ